MKYWGFLLLAILAETAATTALKASAQFTKLGPSVVVVVGYGAAFYFLSLTLKSIPVGVAYAVWSGIGILLITLAGAVFYKQIPDAPALLGLALILAGVIIINLFSKTSAH
ncbi:DMT family transporter [Hymenobacter glacieicola]|uniref:QacE family quaternary ammonium compound efflux SMR transporter n=1 Tax=Hymenobacter glacieicola TaxID=1562124 RepID=A0ABQ1X108_9BACT|nr:multidrug efflux SMR transporter [Hymenobacter glacieicola]GGG52792.1 QacE family quaternary ammonium compound efflux SMR transporter [Hymenobacter glacieicola]